MASFPCSNARAAALLNIGTAYTLRSLTYAQAPTNYGTDFRVASGTEIWQVQTTPTERVVISSNDTYFGIRITCVFHHKRTSLADEETFMTSTVDTLFRTLVNPANWSVKAHIYSVGDDDGDPESNDIEREGNVLTWTFSITVLADAD